MGMEFECQYKNRKPEKYNWVLNLPMQANELITKFKIKPKI
jgi:hypothetical protein